MRIIFIGLFLISFLAGVSGMVMHHQKTGESGVIGDLLNASGFAKREKVNRSASASFIKDTDLQIEKSREMMRAVALTQQGLMEDMADQEQFLEKAQDRVMSLAKQVREYVDSSNTDMLKLREAMDEFNNQSRIMIENGRALVLHNKEQLKNRQQSLEEASLQAIKSSINQNRFEQYAHDALRQRSDFINKSSSNVQSIREQTERLGDKLRNLEHNLTKKEDAQLLLNLKDVQEKSRLIASDIKLKEDKLRDMAQQRETFSVLAKEKADAFISQNLQRFSDSQERMRDQKRATDERVRDQIQRLKEQRRTQ